MSAKSSTIQGQVHPKPKQIQSSLVTETSKLSLGEFPVPRGENMLLLLFFSK